MNNNKNKYLVLCTLNTEKENVLTKYHLDDKNHPTGRRDNPINLKNKNYYEIVSEKFRSG